VQLQGLLVWVLRHQAVVRASGEHLADQGLEAAGPPWEVYERGPAEDPDSATWRTEVVQPVG